MRLIDADALLAELYGCVVENDKIHGMFIYSDLDTPIRNAPTHAYMLTDEDGNIKCSNCGSSECWGNYCMNCGAKMHGVEE